MTTIKAAFLTANEAKAFIAANFESASIKKITSDLSNLTIDEMPFDADGETSAYEVNGGEAIVAYWEAEDAAYTVKFGELALKAGSLYEARAIAREIAAAAEDVNCPGTVSIADDRNGETIDTITIEDYDDEPTATVADVEKALQK